MGEIRKGKALKPVEQQKEDNKKDVQPLYGLLGSLDYALKKRFISIQGDSDSEPSDDDDDDDDWDD